MKIITAVVAAILSIICTSAKCQYAYDAMALAERFALPATAQRCVANNDAQCFATSVLPLKKADVPDTTINWSNLGYRYNDIGNSLSTSDAHTAIVYLQLAAVCFAKTGDMKHLGYALQNMAFVYDEQLQKADSSLYYTNLALGYWEAKGKMVPAANLYKFRAQLCGKLGLYASGKADGHRAIVLYEQARQPMGVMVSYYDLANVFIAERNADSAGFYLGKAKQFWTEQKDTFRIFVVNTALLKCFNIHRKANKELMHENEAILATSSIPNIAIVDFYKTAAENALHVSKNLMFMYTTRLSKVRKKK